MRSKKEILYENYGVSTVEAARELDRADRMNLEKLRPPLDQWVNREFPYEAADHPPLPSIDEISNAMKTNKLCSNVSLNNVCRVGDCVIKFSTAFSLLQVWV